MMKLLVAVGTLAFAILLAVTVALVLPVCGLAGGNMALLVDFCPKSEPSMDNEIHEARVRNAVLEARVAQLQQWVGQRVCEPVAQLPDSSAPVTDAPDITEEDWRNENIGLLEGCWNLDSDYSVEDVDTGEISVVDSWLVCYDAEGNGHQTITYESGTRCKSHTKAWFESEQLVMHDSGDVRCENNKVIFRREINCDLAPDGTADCISRQPESPDGPGGSRVRLRR